MPELILCHSHRALRSWLHFSFKFQIIYPFPSFVNYSSSTSRRCLCVSKFFFASLLPSSIHFHILHWIWWLNASGSPSIQFGRRCVVSIVDSLSLCISFFFFLCMLWASFEAHPSRPHTLFMSGLVSLHLNRVAQSLPSLHISNSCFLHYPIYVIESNGKITRDL